MTTTELIELLKKHERGGATGRPREVMFEVDDRIIDTDGIEVTGSGDGLISELYLSLPSAEPEKVLIARINLSEEQVREAVERAKSEIVQVLPSVYPEIRCKDCKYYNAEEHLCSDLMGFGRYWDENDYCSFAERRTDATD